MQPRKRETWSAERWALGYAVAELIGEDPQQQREALNEINRLLKRPATELDRIRVERLVCRIFHQLGPRVIAEALLEIAERHNAMPTILNLLTTHAAVPFETLRAVGGDRFTPRHLHVVPPADDGEAAP
jgi:hypothetical protein